MSVTTCDTFARRAEQFCAWVEGPPGDTVAEAAQARQHLADLYVAALELPVSGSRCCQAEGPDDAAWKVVYRRLGALPFNYYSTVDPLEVPGMEFLTGDLADDLADIWRDLRAGMELHRAGKAEEAGLEWRVRFDTHWARHAADALAALQSWHSSRAGA